MRRSSSIVKCISGLLLLVFALGITPKIYLHDMFAKHVDASPKGSCAPFQLNKSGYNCDCDNLVAESTFVSDQPVFSFPLFSYYSPYTFNDISFCSSSKNYCPLRGPPVNSI